MIFKADLRVKRKKDYQMFFLLSSWVQFVHFNVQYICTYSLHCFLKEELRDSWKFIHLAFTSLCGRVPCVSWGRRAVSRHTRRCYMDSVCPRAWSWRGASRALAAWPWNRIPRTCVEYRCAPFAWNVVQRVIKHLLHHWYVNFI